MSASNSKPKSGKRKLNSDIDTKPTKKQALEDQKGDSASILNLPEDILAEIFKLIPVSQWPSLESVSRQFRGAISMAWRQLRHLRLDEFIFKESLLKQSRSFVLIEVLEKFGDRTPNIKSISGFSAICPNSSKPYELPEIAFQRMATAFKHLEMVDFSNSRLSADNLTDFLAHSNSQASLKHLDISSIRGSIFLTGFNHGQLKLETLKIKNLSRMESQFLRETSLPWLTTFKAPDVEISATDLTSFISRNPQLEKLEFEMEYWPPGIPSTTHQSLFDTVATLENLSALKIITTKVQVQLSTSYFKSAIIKLVKSLGYRGKIVEFGLANLSNVTDEIMEEVANHLVGLVSLELSIGRCSVLSIKNLGTKLKQLQRAYFMLGSSTNNATISALAANFDSLECLHLEISLESLHLELKPCEFDNLAHLRNLKELRIRDCRLVNSTLKSWAKSESIGPKLEILELIECECIKSDGLVSLIKTSPLLHRLVVLGASLEDSVLEVITEMCPRLRYLELSLFEKVQTTSIQSVIDGCSRLEQLKIASTDWISSEQLKFPKYQKILLEFTRQSKQS